MFLIKNLRNGNLLLGNTATPSKSDGVACLSPNLISMSLWMTKYMIQWNPNVNTK